MPLTSIEIDRDKCTQAAELLGTHGDSATVDAALDALLAKRDQDAATERFIGAMRDGRYSELFDERVTQRQLW